MEIMNFNKANAVINGEKIELSCADNGFCARDVRVNISGSGEISICAAASPIGYVILECQGFDNALMLGGAWERSYGDLEWKRVCDKQMPWYFAAESDGRVYCFGVKTGANAFCSWRCGEGKITLTIDIRNGSDEIVLNGRELLACTVVSEEYDTDAFSALTEFCKKMCDNPRLPNHPIYGGNDWYCNYGDNSAEKILHHAKRVAECAPKGGQKPYMVIDDGWELCHRDRDGAYFNGGPWRYCNDNFGDMKKLAEDMEAIGVIPGIWFRPLWTVESVPEELILKKDDIKITLDPSVKATLDMVKRDVETIKNWGYKLIKHDFTTFDISGKWGFEMDLFGGEVHFADKTQTTAEIIKDLYMAIREAAGDDVLIMGCNTVGHLAAGIFDIQRTGDDTSGREWERTKKYGINTLAYCMPQHNTFYCADADCVGITNEVPWKKNQKWLDVLSKSGTALFVSIAEDAYSNEVKRGLTAAFEKAAKNTEPSVPSDRQRTMLPKRWKSVFGIDEYEW